MCQPIFKEKFDPGKVYILKKNIQRKKGIKLTSDYNEISEANKKKYVMVQEKKESIIITKQRKTVVNRVLKDASRQSSVSKHSACHLINSMERRDDTHHR